MKKETDVIPNEDTTNKTTTATTEIKETAKTDTKADNSSDSASKSNHVKATRSIGYNKYIGSQWKQECVPGLSPNLKLSRLHRILFCIGIPLLSVGIYLWTIKDVHQVYVFDYTDCKPSAKSSSCADIIRRQSFDNRSCTCSIKIHIKDHMHGKVFINYRLENFHQNLRRYRESRDEIQLISPFKKPDLPACLTPKRPAKTCNQRYSYNNKKVIYPCGQIPNSMFSDRISLIKNGKKLRLDRPPYRRRGFKDEFKNPKLKYTDKEFIQRFSKPIAWSTKFWDNFWKEGGVLSSDFYYWMRISALPSFGKPYRYFKGNISECRSHGVKKGICRGYYILEIQYNFDVKSINGRKKIEIASDKPIIHDKSGFLAIACTAVGSFSVVLGFFSLINFLCSRSKRANKFKTSYSSSEFIVKEPLIVEERPQVGTTRPLPLVEKETAVFVEINEEDILNATITRDDKLNLIIQPIPMKQRANSAAAAMAVST